MPINCRVRLLHLVPIMLMLADYRMSPNVWSEHVTCLHHCSEWLVLVWQWMFTSSCLLLEAFLQTLPFPYETANCCSSYTHSFPQQFVLEQNGANHQHVSQSIKCCMTWTWKWGRIFEYISGQLLSLCIVWLGKDSCLCETIENNWNASMFTKTSFLNK